MLHPVAIGDRRSADAIMNASNATSASPFHPACFFIGSSEIVTITLGEKIPPSSGIQGGHSLFFETEKGMALRLAGNFECRISVHGGNGNLSARGAVSLPITVVLYRSAPSRSKTGCFFMWTTAYKSPGGPLSLPGSPSPAIRKNWPSSTPAGIETSILLILRIVPLP